MHEGATNRLRALVHAHQRQCKGLEALLFDLDGTLADTMDFHCKAYQRVLAKHGGHLARDDYFRLVGPTARVTIPLFMEASGLGRGQEDVVKRLHAEKKAELEQILLNDRPNALPALDLLVEYANFAKIAVVTSGNRRGAGAILKSLGIDDHVDVLVTSDDVLNGKPDKEPYMKALVALGSASGRALAFEDHEAGIRSANAAGLSVLDVRNFEFIEANVLN